MKKLIERKIQVANFLLESKEQKYSTPTEKVAKRVLKKFLFNGKKLFDVLPSCFYMFKLLDLFYLYFHECNWLCSKSAFPIHLLLCFPFEVLKIVLY